jgi:Flp pilus assembly pilin Flp
MSKSIEDFVADDSGAAAIEGVHILWLIAQMSFALLVVLTRSAVGRLARGRTA